MKRTFRILLLLAIPFAILSCDGGDDAPPPHEVGVWMLESIQDIVPATHNWFALELSVEQIGYNSYTLTLNPDGTYSERIDRTDLSTIANSGAWSIDDTGSILTIEPENSDQIIEWTVEQNEVDLLKISRAQQTLAVSNDELAAAFEQFQQYGDAAIDSVQAYLNSEQGFADADQIDYVERWNFARQIED